jgi:hypothetical protein
MESKFLKHRFEDDQPGAGPEGCWKRRKADPAMKIGGIESTELGAGAAEGKKLTVRTGSEGEGGVDKAGRDCKWASEKADWVDTVVDGRSADSGKAKWANCTVAMLGRGNCTAAAAVAAAAAGIGWSVTAIMAMSAKPLGLASSSVPESL